MNQRLADRMSALKKPTLVIAANTAWYVHNFRTNLIRELSDRYAVTVAADVDDYAARLVELGCEFHSIPFVHRRASVRGELKTLLAFRSLYRTLKPTYILNFTPKANIFSTLAVTNDSSVVINNISGLGRAFSKGPLSPIRAVTGVLYRVVANRVDHTFYQNPRDLRLGLSQGFSKNENSSLLPGSGVDLSRFRPMLRDKTEPIHFLHVARLMPAKGTLDFLQAAKRLRKEFGDRIVQFTIAGPDSGLSAEDRTLFRTMLAETGTNYVGMVDSVEGLLRSAHCVVLPSSYPEGVPRSLIEAAASGKLVVCYPNAGSEQIVRDGQTGFVTSESTVPALTQALRNVITMDAKSYSAMCEKGVELAHDEFDERIVIAMYLGVLGQHSHEALGA